MPMAKLLHKLLIVLVLLFSGCAPSDKPIFNLPTNIPVQEENRGINFFIRDLAAPVDTNTDFVLGETDLPDGSVYFSITQAANQSVNFLLDIRFKNITGVYDMPLVITYDPNSVAIDTSNPQQAVIDGPVASRLRRFLDPQFTTLLGVNHPTQAGRFLVHQSIMEDLGTSQNYNGTIVSIPMRSLIPRDFKATFGFDIANSRLLDKTGSSINVRFFGGTMQRTQ